MKVSIKTVIEENHPKQKNKQKHTPTRWEGDHPGDDPSGVRKRAPKRLRLIGNAYSSAVIDTMGSDFWEGGGGGVVLKVSIKTVIEENQSETQTETETPTRTAVVGGAVCSQCRDEPATVTSVQLFDN